jgi:ABC-type transporter Mla subunit MlaD
MNRFVDIRNGRGDALPPGTTLGLQQTDQPVEVQDMLDLLTPEMQREVQTLVLRAERSIDERGPDIERTLRVGGASLQQVAGLLDDVSRDRQLLRNLVRRTGAGVSQLASADEDLSGTLTDAAVLLDVAAARQTELRRSLRRAPEALAASRGLMRRVPAEVPQLRRTLREASAATTELGDVAQSLQRASTVAPETLAAARTVMASARRHGPVLQDLLTTAAPALQVSARAVTAMGPVLDQFRARTPDSVNWLILLGAATASYNAVGHGVRLTGTSVEPPRRLTSGCRAGLLPRPFYRDPGDLACEPWEDFAASFLSGGIDPRRSINQEKAASRDEGLG